MYFLEKFFVLFSELSNVLGIIDGPMKNARAAPKFAARAPIAVAVKSKSLTFLLYLLV